MFTYTVSSIGIGNSIYLNAEEYRESYTDNNSNYTSSYSTSDSTRGNFGVQNNNGEAGATTEAYLSNKTTYNSDTAGGRTQVTSISEYTSSGRTNGNTSNGYGVDYYQLTPYAYGGADGETRSGENSILANTYLLPDGLYVSSYQSYQNYVRRTATDSNSAVINGVTVNDSDNYSQGELTLAQSYTEYFVYRQAETRYNNSYYYTSSIIIINNTDTTSSTFSTSSEYITTIYNTYAFNSTGTTTTTQDDPFFPTITTSYEFSTTGRVTYAHYGTSTGEDVGSPLSLSKTDTIEFTYLSQTTEGTGTNTYLEITTYTSNANFITTYTSDGNYKKQIIYTSYSDYYYDFGQTVTGMASAGGNWAWGTVGGILVRNGGANQSFINKFTDLSVITQNTLIDPNKTFNVYGITIPTNNSSFAFTYIVDSIVTTTCAQIYSETTNQKSYYFDSEAGSVASTNITYWQFPSSTEGTLYINAATTTETGVCPAGSVTYTYISSANIDVPRTLTVLLGSISNSTISIESFENSIQTFIQTFTGPAVTSIYTSSSSEDIIGLLSRTFIGTTYGNDYYSHEVQSFDTQTAKSYYWVGDQFYYGIKLLKRIHGDGAYANIIYLHTSVSNKTNNTGYYIYSNNLSNDVLANPLPYNITSILDNGQLSNYQENADNQYYYNAGFASIPNDEAPFPYIATPISQSSYSWIVYESSPPYSATTRITASFRGVSDSAFYTTINGNGSTSTSSTGTISFYFADPAGTRLYLNIVSDGFGSNISNTGVHPAIGGKQRLYTVLDTIFPENISTKYAYTIKDSVLTSSVDHIYLQTDFLSSGTSFYSGPIFSASSVITNLKYIRLNNDSWIAQDRDLGQQWLGGVILDSPITVFTPQVYNIQTNRGIWASFETYYGSTYLY